MEREATEEAAQYPEWNATLDAIVSEGGTTMLLGGIDVGKTTFARLLVNHALAKGRRVAVLDGDVGQSEIGPPGCIGLGFAEAPIPALSAIAPHALAFVGAVSPVGRLPEHIAGMVRLACGAGERQLVIDTGGYIRGPEARRLIQTEFDLLAPAHLVALQRREELQSALHSIRRRSDCRLHTPPVAAVIGVKSPGLRAQRRAMRFSHYFAGSESRQFPLDEIAIYGSWLGSGKPVPAHILRFLNETLGEIRVHYAETSAGHLGLMTNQPLPPDCPELGIIQGQLRVNEISVTVARRWKHLLVGLETSSGKLLGLGLLDSLDFRRRMIGIHTPIQSPAAVRIVRLGLQRLRPDGTDEEALKQREL